MEYIKRNIEDKISKSLKNFPVTAIIGPRQCGKSTLVKHIVGKQDSVYLDLERPSDIEKLSNPEFFLSSQKGKLICIDEIQRTPELFPLIRSLVDEWNQPGCFLILGSASRDLLKQSSESLAGRISYKTLTPFLWQELRHRKPLSLEQYLARGGFPQSVLAKDDEISFEWRENFISTFLERDLLQWSGFTPVTMRRLWQMLAHVNGQTVNYSVLSNSLGVSSSTIKNYIDLLEGTFMVSVVPPYHSNLGKRLVKAPKIYISDSGIATALLGIRNFQTLAGHPVIGSLWEQIVLVNLQAAFPEATFYYYRTTHGAEIDFVMRLFTYTFAIECKSSLSPSLSKGNYNAMEDIDPSHVFVAAPVETGWGMKENINVVNLDEIIAQIQNIIKLA